MKETKEIIREIKTRKLTNIGHIVRHPERSTITKALEEEEHPGSRI
jgi:hypothetical protein